MVLPENGISLAQDLKCLESKLLIACSAECFESIETSAGARVDTLRGNLPEPYMLAGLVLLQISHARLQERHCAYMMAFRCHVQEVSPQNSHVHESRGFHSDLNDAKGLVKLLDLDEGINRQVE
jgi:hypothetical protein